MDTEYIEIGRVVKTHGYKGELKINLALEKLKNIDEIKAFYFKEGNSFVPYFLETVQIIADDAAIMLFDSFDSKESAKLIVGYVLYASSADVEEKVVEETINFDGYINYTIQDKTLGHIGTIAEVVIHPHQIFAIIIKNEEEVLIPLHAELVIEINDEESKIIMNLPEGLLDL